MNEVVEVNEEESPSFSEGRDETLTWKTVGTFILSFIGLSFLTGIVVGVVSIFIGHDLFDTIFQGYRGLLLDALFFLIVILVFKKIRLSLVNSFSLRPFKYFKTYLFLIAGIIILFGSQLVLIAVLGIDDTSGQAQNLDLESAKSSIWSMLLFFLSISIITPIKEEILFRGIIYRFLAERYHFVVGLIASSVIFGLLHGGYPFSAITMGIVFALLYKLTKSLMVPIALHIGWNLFVAIVQFIT